MAGDIGGTNARLAVYSGWFQTLCLVLYRVDDYGCDSALQ
jgi:glucokinase